MVNRVKEEPVRMLTESEIAERVDWYSVAYKAVKDPYPSGPTDHNVIDRVADRLRQRLPRIIGDVVFTVRREIKSEEDSRDIIQVRFHSGLDDETWSYRCPGAKVGDWVVVPPTPYCSYDQYVPVVALGRGAWRGVIKSAKLAKPHKLGAHDPESY